MYGYGDGKGVPNERVSKTLCAAWILVVCLVVPAVAQDPSLENRLKAAVVSKLPAFTEWPPAALDGHDSLDVCVVRPSPFGSTLRDLLAGETIGGRPLALRELADARVLDRCHVLFVPANAAANRKEILNRTRKLPILTVGDYAGFLDEGGIVYLRVVEGRVRFEINIAPAQTGGIKISSQLLKLALNVRGGQ
jgi:hypothetical protein